MIKLLIVEDIPRQRRAILNSIDWKAIDIEITGEAENGIKALECIAEQEPDIVLTDIEMPGMDGIELANRLRRSYPGIRVIFLTSHSDFEYARMAVNLDVFSYISKPVDSDELKETFKSVVQAIMTDREKLSEEIRLKEQLKESLPALREKFYRELILGVYKTEEEVHSRMNFLNLRFEKSSFCISIFEIDDYENVTEGMSEENKQLIVLRMTDKVKQLLESRNDFVPIDILGPRFVALINITAEENDDGKAYLYNLFTELHKPLTEALNCSITIGISSIGCDTSHMPILYSQARKALKGKFNFGNNSIIMYEDINQNEHLNLKIDSIHSNLKNVLGTGEREQVSKFVDEIFSNMDNNVFLPETLIKNLCFSILNYTELTLINMNDSFDNVLDKDALPWYRLAQSETLEQLKNWIKDILFKVCDHIASKNNTKNKKIIDQIINIISTRYFEELTVQDIAKEVYLSPNYANLIFKTETGSTIPDYLTNYRINKAKYLLKDPEIKVYEIGEMVGYKNKSHFTQLFKQITGMTPNDYRKKV